MTMTSQLTAYTKEIQIEINRRLLEILDEQIMRAGKIDPAYKTLWLDIKKYLLRGGKRLRPTLLMLGYEAGGGEDRMLAYELGVAVELIHAFLLIHDDGSTRLQKLNPAECFQLFKSNDYISFAFFNQG